ncbi:UNVERIFIED_CONTAM: zinc finger motif, C2HC5-type protein [Hammondia hammondi]|eukprot:XP_008882376.1 zinc finger motif, C2HC5-type protein [Hammondia hammondi]
MEEQPSLPPELAAWALEKLRALLQLEDADAYLVEELVSFIPGDSGRGREGGLRDPDDREKERRRREEEDLSQFIESLVAPMRPDFSPEVARQVAEFASEFARRLRDSRRHAVGEIQGSRDEKKKFLHQLQESEGGVRRNGGGKSHVDSEVDHTHKRERQVNTPLPPGLSAYDSRSSASFSSGSSSSPSSSSPSSPSASSSSSCSSSFSSSFTSCSSLSCSSSSASSSNWGEGISRHGEAVNEKVEKEEGEKEKGEKKEKEEKEEGEKEKNEDEEPQKEDEREALLLKRRETKRVKKKAGVLQLNAFGLAASRLSLGESKRAKYMCLQRANEKSSVRCVCLCMGTEHGVHGSCMYCGKVACKMEGGGECLFCGNKIKTHSSVSPPDRGPENSRSSTVPPTEDEGGRGRRGAHRQRSQRRLEFSYSGNRCPEREDTERYEAESDGWLEEERPTDATPEERETVKQKRIHALKRAVALKDRLVHFDRTSAVRSVVFDDAADWFDEARNIWIEANRRAEAAERWEEQARQADDDRRRVRITLDLVNKTVVDETLTRAEERMKEQEENLQRFQLACAATTEEGQDAEDAEGGSSQWGGQKTKIYFDEEKKRGAEEKELKKPSAFPPLSKEDTRRQLERLEEIQRQVEAQAARRWRDEREAEEELAEWEAEAGEISADRDDEKENVQHSSGLASVQNPSLSSTSRRLLEVLQASRLEGGGEPAGVASWAPKPRSRGDRAAAASEGAKPPGFFVSRSAPFQQEEDFFATRGQEPQGKWQQDLQSRLRTQAEAEERRRLEAQEKARRQTQGEDLLPGAPARSPEGAASSAGAADDAFCASALPRNASSRVHALEAGKKKRLFRVEEVGLLGEEDKPEESEFSHLGAVQPPAPGGGPGKDSLHEYSASSEELFGMNEADLEAWDWERDVGGSGFRECETGETREDLEDAQDEGLCLTVRQPFASLIVLGFKAKEGRNWPCAHRGRMWIHAAATPPNPATIEAARRFYEQLLHLSASVSCLWRDTEGHQCEARGDAQGSREAKETALPPFPREFPTSAVLGCVTVVDCVEKTEQASWGLDETEGCKFEFTFRRPRRLIVPVKVVGRQPRIWNLTRGKLPHMQAALLKARWPRALGHKFKERRHNCGDDNS